MHLAPTMSEFMQTLEKAAQSIRQEPQTQGDSQHKATIAILAGVDLFMRFVTRNSHDFSVSTPPYEYETCETNVIHSFQKRLVVLKTSRKIYYPELL